MCELLPGMQTWEDFVAAVVGFGSPLRSPLHKLPAYVEKGIQLRARLSVGDAARYRQDMVRRIVHLAEVDGPSESPRWGLLQRLGEAAGHPDKRLAMDAAEPDGFRLLGKLAPNMGWPPRDVRAMPFSQGEHQAARGRILEAHRSERSRGYYRLPSKHADALYEMLQAQAEKGYWEEFSIKEADQKFGGFAAWLFFAVEEQGQNGEIKLRGCLSPESANDPDMVVLPDHVYMAGLDGYLAMCSKLSETLAAAGRTPPLEGWKEDYVDGFRQLPLASQDRCMLCALGRSPSGDIRVFAPSRLLFGPRGGPHVFCRVTDMVAAICSVLLLAPTTPHVDDMCGVEEEGGADSARRAVLALHSALNLELKVSKAVPPRELQRGASRLVVLGGDVDFSSTCADRKAGLVAQVDVPAEKAEKYRRQITSTLTAGRLTPAGRLERLSAAGTLLLQWHWAALAGLSLGPSGRGLGRVLVSRSRQCCVLRTLASASSSVHQAKSMSAALRRFPGARL